ncbi:MAG: hypothetical protein NTW16_14785 [Bacteroidetes bacterium]|nr:hypothetical protein [Bacteroidota bacterium]
MTDLRETIIHLEMKRSVEGRMLEEQFHLAVDSMKPVSLIRTTFKEVISSGDLKENIVSTSVGLAAGILGKIIIGSVTKSPFKKLLGTMAMFGITKVISRNPETVNSVGKSVLKMIGSTFAGRGHPA